MILPQTGCRPIKQLALLICLLSATQISQAAAAGKPAGTSISNSASVAYQVSTISQTPESSNTVTFVVDRKVDFTVTTDETAAVSVTPGSSGNVLTFTVDNTGNDTFDFDLASVALAGAAAKYGGTDNIDATAATAYVESGATAGYQSAQDTATAIDNLAAGSSVKVYIVSSFPLGLSNGDIASYYLRATAKDSAGGNLANHDADAENTSVVQNVMATDDGPEPTDINRDKIDSDYADYKVAVATLSVIKSSIVESDPVGSTVPKPIPGAVVRYEIQISNAAGAAMATNVTITDDLSTEIGQGDITFETQYNATAGQGIVVAHPDYAAGADTEYTNANDSAEFGGVGADWNVTATNKVTVTGITLDAGETATVKFKVIVQ